MSVIYSPPDPPTTPDELSRKRGLIRRWTAMYQAWRGDIDAPEDATVPDPQEMLSTVGSARVLFPYVAQIFALSADYMKAVSQIRVLVEENPVFKAIDRKISWSVGSMPTTVRMKKETRIGRKAQRLIEALLARIKCDELKPEWTAKMLREGGLSLEVVTSTERDAIDRVEYRPHDSIRPLKNKWDRFVDPAKAYQQIDVSGAVIADFALWQMVDVNLEETPAHSRGVPHLQSARLQLEHGNTMIRGLVQKWIREAGSIEHFKLKDARRWPEVMKFQKENEGALMASPDAMVRQIFTMGDKEIERITADSHSFDTESIELIIDLVFLVAGTPKELFGFRFKSGAMREMIKLLTDHHNQTLEHVETRLFYALRKICNLELMNNGINPDYVPYELSGGQFQPTRQVKIQKETIDVGAVSMNDLRRASNLTPYEDPMFEVPGLFIDGPMARALAEKLGVELPVVEVKPPPPQPGMKPGDPAKVAPDRPE